MDKAVVEKKDEKALERKKRTIELLQRALGLRHKIKVHDTMPRSETHEEIALNTWARWELEDELSAIEELLKSIRAQSVAEKRSSIEKTGPKKNKKFE